MQRTGHTSNAVREYKRFGAKLRAVTLDAQFSVIIMSNGSYVIPAYISWFC